MDKRDIDIYPFPNVGNNPFYDKEFHIGNLLPMMGSTKGFDSELSRKSILDIIDNTNKEILSNNISVFNESSKSNINKYYRVTYNGIGIYEAYRKSVDSDTFKAFLNSDAAKWLPKPDIYIHERDIISFFTEKGYKLFMKKTCKSLIHSMDKDRIKIKRYNISDSDILYKDEYQIVTRDDILSSLYEEKSIEYVNDKGEDVPKVCPKCGSKVGVFFRGEPVFLCSNDKCEKYFGTVPFNANESGYDRPYSFDDIVQNYGKDTADKLMKDPAHKYRADTGIELIHKEPTLQELDRIYHNWQKMDDSMKKKSDEKSVQLFGCDNITNYNKLRKTYSLYEASDDVTSLPIIKNDKRYYIKDS